MNAVVESGIGQPAHVEVDRVLALQRAAFAAERYPSLAVRRDRLARLLALTLENESAIAAAIDADFGGRARQETLLAETYLVASGARDAMRNLARWMRGRRVRAALALLPGHGEILPQPLGVVGIVSPWNYPYQLALAPALGALAAGNRVAIKPSELTPRTSALIADLVGRRFDPSEMAVVLGDAEVGRAFVAQKWDHLFFTGSTAVGRMVARAAAENLVPCTLELGGKSPALVDEKADFSLAVPRLVAGKLFNAGQTCIAPDYALVPVARRDEFVAAARAAIERLYPNVAANPDYTAIVNERHHARLQRLQDDARDKGASVTVVGAPAPGVAPTGRRMPPAIVTGVRDDMAIMQEEIFGPLLPVETYASFDEAIAKVESRPRPLAFYYFGHDRRRQHRVLRETIAGGVTLNDALLHFAHEELPFGGVGDSGIGAYHGEHSFRLFSNEKAVFHQTRVSPARLLWPPYGPTFDRVLGMLKRINT
jgi:coniferyl-aldehyde dehydrogenase